MNFSPQGHSVSHQAVEIRSGERISTACYKLGQMILPQLQADAHGVDVVGMFFFHHPVNAPC